MTDYFNSEYSSFVGAKGLPSPADTPYETPSFIRSKRSSRATANSSREQSVSPPPLPPDTTEAPEKSRDGRYGALDPRRFTPTLHASLVSEILTLRRELDSKNNLVENLETNLSTTKDENETLTQQLAQNAKEVRRAKQQVQQMEKGTYDAVEDLVKERDLAKTNAEDLKSKLEATQKTARRQDEDAERTQKIWEAEKETWDNERRQMERRLHVTETRLRKFVEEMTSQQAATEASKMHQDDLDEFRDSGLGNESDTGSIRSTTTTTTTTPAKQKHRRNTSSVSLKGRGLRNYNSNRVSITPEPFAKPSGYTLADELGIDEEDEYDMDEFDHPDDELEYGERLRKTMESRQSFIGGDPDSKAKRVLGLTTENVDSPGVSPTAREFPKRSLDSVSVSDPTKQSLELPSTLPTLIEVKTPPAVQYVDTGYQPSPPESPVRGEQATKITSVPKIQEPAPATENVIAPSNRRSTVEIPSHIAASPISPPETPVVAGMKWPENETMPSPSPAYNTASTQTDLVETDQPKGHAKNRDSLSPPSFVPSIAIHPPTSRPSSPRPYVLPPGTKNAFTQANIRFSSRDASVQTEEIRVDKRPVKLPPHLLPGYLLPSPEFQEHSQPTQAKRPTTSGSYKNFSKTMPAPAVPSSPPPQSPQASSGEVTRNNSQKDLRSMPLRAIPLPRPVLSPALPQEPAVSEGPLNRSSQYGVTKSGQLSSQLLDMEKDSEVSDIEESIVDFDSKDISAIIPALSKPPHGRFGLSEPPKAVPEDKEISPERRPDTAGSTSAAPAPSVSSSRANSRAARGKAPARLNSYKELRSRSPSFGSMASSSYDTQSVAAPPYPIPTRSSSRVLASSHSEGSNSPTPHHADVFGNRRQRSFREQQSRQNSLRKVQSAAAIRNANRRTSPKKGRRRRRSPDLTPVQSMAFESPPQTHFPVPELPTPLQDGFGHVKGSVDMCKPPTTAASSAPRRSEETNLVDAIAGTMVGEWMWKYIRERKSFGVREDFPIGEDGSFNIGAHGSRHKRWVWLSPYERTIMWDNKQPTSHSALLGKKGRKLAIQSVLEVQDHTPLPKSADLNTACNRSIIILTPSRALKFTTVSQERHLLWMTALSFLAQSGRLPSQIPPMPTALDQARPPIPTVPAFEPPPVKRSRSPSFGRSTVRDSIRLAKGKRPELPKSTSQPESGPSQAMLDLEGPPQHESADFPSVPRLYISTNKHQRKRSNTSPRIPSTLNGFRSFSTTAVSSTASSALQPTSTSGSSFRVNLPSASSRSGGSRTDSLASPDRPNFFEAVGTVRMEAFVDPNVKDGVLYVPAPPGGAPQTRRRRNDSETSQASIDKRRGGFVFDEFGQDPFRSFG